VSKVNNHPQSGWLDSPPVRGTEQGHVSAIGALFREPSPKAMVFQKTINSTAAGNLNGLSLNAPH